MTKVYAVWYGEYSDRNIYGIFSTREMADACVVVQSKLDECESYYVIEYELDEHTVDANTDVRTYYYMSILTRDLWNYSHTELLGKKGEFDLDERDNITESRVYTTPVIINKKFDDYGNVISIEVCSVEGFEHAKKVAVERYQMYTQQEFENNPYILKESK